MGTGNYRHREGRTVILDLFDGITPWDEDEDLHRIEADAQREDLTQEIMAALSKAWELDGETWRRNDRDCLIIAHNALHDVWTHEDSYGHVFVTFGMREGLDELEGLSRATYEDRAERFFDKLNDSFPSMRVASCAWTSRLRRPAPEKAAA
jgi:hypothetical protein